MNFILFSLSPHHETSYEKKKNPIPSLVTWNTLPMFPLFQSLYLPFNLLMSQYFHGSLLSVED